MANRRAKPERERVAMRHPSGKFTVQVSPARANVLRERGYTDATPGKAKPATAPEPDGERDYTKLTVAQLREEAERRFLEVPKAAKKDDLVALLEDDDEE